MGKWIAAWSFLIGCSLTSPALAFTADDYALAGRAALFERTRAGLVQACDVFAAALNDVECSDCDADRELVFMHAVARLARLFIDYPGVLTADYFFRLAETFGVPLDGIAFFETEGEGSQEDTDRDMRRAGVAFENIRQTLSEAILPQLDAIISDLDSIEDQPDPFVVYLVPEETGLSGDLEVDYGDVLVLKGLLLAYRGFLAAQIARAPNAAAPELSVLDDLSTALSMLDDPDGDAALLTQARQDWIAALSCCITAVEHIAAEDSPTGVDPQEDEFVYVDPDTQPRLDSYRQMLVTLRNSLADGAAGVPGAAPVRTYDLHDADSSHVGRLTLVFDVRGAEGNSGHLALTDGMVLDVDWFVRLDPDRIGVSLFSGSQDLEGWLEATIDSDLELIRDVTLDLWGARSSTMIGITGRPAGDRIQPMLFEASLRVGPIEGMSRSGEMVDQRNPWAQPRIFDLQPDWPPVPWPESFEVPRLLSHL